MNFSDEDKYNEILANHKQQISECGFKKYVVSISNRHVPLVDSMSIEERNNIVNDIIELHSENLNEQKQIKSIIKFFTFALLIFIFLLFAAPALIWLTNQSIYLTKNNYAEMQHNFQVLYSKHK